MTVCDGTMQASAAELDAVKEAAADKEADLASSLAGALRELAASQAEVVSLREARSVDLAQVRSRLPCACAVPKWCSIRVQEILQVVP